MSEFNIERLRSAVKWAEKEARKETSAADASRGGLWDQGAWMRGLLSKRPRKVKSIRVNRTTNTELEGAQLRQVKCGSSYCVAGHVCADEGDSFVAYEWEVDDDGTVHAAMVIPRGSDEAVDVFTRAQELLGITRDEAHKLFGGYNTIEMVREYAGDIARNYGEEL